jgi:hypothetical protein
MEKFENQKAIWNIWDLQNIFCYVQRKETFFFHSSPM